MKFFALTTMLACALCGLLAAQEGGVDASFLTGSGIGPHNGEVRAIVVQPDGKIVIGGGFSQVDGVNRSNIARLNADGSLDTDFDPVANDMVYALAVQPDGKIVAAGNFTQMGGQSRMRVARLNTDGSLDTSFNTGANGIVEALALQSDGKIVIGGNFSTPRVRIARLNTDGSFDTDFDPGTGVNSVVYALAVSPDGSIYLGGNFSQVNGIARGRIARLNTDGSLDTTFLPGGTGANAHVYSLALQPDGKVLVGGSFTQLSGAARVRIARLNTDGSVDTEFDPGTGAADGAFGQVNALALRPNGKVMLGGYFTEVDGVLLNRIAQLNADGNVDTDFDPGTGVEGGVVRALALQPDGKALIGGGFTTVDGMDYKGVARLNLGPQFTSTPELTAVAGQHYSYTATTTAATTITVGDLPEWLHFDGIDTISGTPTVAEIGMTYAISLTSTNQFGEAEQEYELSVVSDPPRITSVAVVTATAGIPYFYAVTASGLPAPTLSAGQLPAWLTFDATTGELSGVPPTASSGTSVDVAITATTFLGEQDEQAFTIQVSSTLTGGGIGGGGCASSSGGATGMLLLLLLGLAALRLRRSNRVTIRQMSAAANPLPPKRLALGIPVLLFLCGGALAAQDGGVDTSFQTGSGPNDQVWAMAVQPDGKVVIAGYFTQVNGIPRSHVARLHPDGSLDMDFIPDVNSWALSLALQPDGKILIGGHFTRVDGVDRNRIARLNANGSLDATFNPGWGVLNTTGHAWIHSIVMQPNGKVLIGGHFTQVDTVIRGGLARLNADGSLDAAFLHGAGADNNVRTLALESDGSILIGGSFTQFDGSERNRIARLRADGSLDPDFHATANADIWRIVQQPDHKILVAGAFTAINGQERLHVTRLNADGSLDEGFQPEMQANATPKTLVLQPDGKILVGGGYFEFINGVIANLVIRLNADGSIDPAFNAGTGTNNEISCMVQQPNMNILIGGTFTKVNGVDRTRIARLSNPRPVMSSAPSLTAIAGQQYAYTVTTAGPAAIITISGLPEWLSFDGVDTISGTPTEADIGMTDTIAVTAFNDHGETGQEFQISVEGEPPAILAGELPAAVPGVTYSHTITATGIPAPTLSAQNLPAWLNFDPATGELSGTPGNFIGQSEMFTITAENGWAPTAERSFTITVQSGLAGGGAAGGGCAVGKGSAAALLALLMIGTLARGRRWMVTQN